ncbi:Rne/Rng family ribonuclease [Polymorphobacter sp. PAMC 29334]|uniref:Rne/Rng family ribonuclease n=1 Tax=Polymorphobacter sp. PAMC 29334 TaxID=2862331 RepID=UPI001C762A25|nr:Rne/Rng family ribonuclease [Polymorphobacter sp. PAMC 29334]QYE36193.1 Rne/Rng family ribonuclease [Polymorphobacter sp. PAMC 29334]
MSQRMLIDARHPEETRVAVVNGNRIEEFDFEAAERKQLKGNIYLAKVTRVEPSLQAAFIDYGGNRHGFLAFSEIHPDYYQIPKEDRDALLREEAELTLDEHHDEPHEGEDGEEVAVTGGADDAGSDVLRRQRQALRRRYKIQEVIRRRQVLLVQVVKEERGNKGAAMTTYLSLAGRFCVLMPNTAHGGGISRKISNLGDRKRLKSIMADLQLPAGMGAIVRTAGLKRTKVEIKRDFDYLTRLWDEIRETTLSSVAPCLVHQDSDLIKRAIRDIYSREIEQVLVDGPDGYAAASTFMQLLMPNHVAKVVEYADPVPLFQRFGVEASLAGMYQPVVQLKSGGYIVINPTEALVSIDVNSGRSTREHGIEETAYKTNLEAADEIGRQLRLRDMAGLVVIDFIDMEVGGNNRRVERAMKEAMKNDRARIQIGRISSFGLMEMSRQRLRTGVLEASTHVCPMCDGSGYVRSVASAALAALRALEAEAIKGRATEFSLRAGLEVAMYILNRKRADVVELEERYGIAVETIPDETLMGPNFVLDAGGPAPLHPVVMSLLPPPVKIDDDDEIPDTAEEHGFDDEEDEEAERPARREGRGRGRGRSAPADDAGEGDTAETASDAEGDDGEEGAERPARAEGAADGGRDSERGGRGRRRRRRGGGRDRKPEGDAAEGVEPVADIASNADVSVTGEDAAEVVAGDGVAPLVTAESAGEGEARRRRRGRRGGRRREGGPAASEVGVDNDTVTESAESLDDTGLSGGPIKAAVEAQVEVAAATAEAIDPVDAPVEAVPAKKPRRSRAKKPVEAAEAAVEEAPAPEPVAEPAAELALEPAAEAVAAAPKPRRSRRKAVAAAPEAAEAAPEPAVVAEPDAFVDSAKIVEPEPVTPQANDAAPEASPAGDEPAAPRKGGWWQRTFGN